MHDVNKIIKFNITSITVLPIEIHRERGLLIRERYLVHLVVVVAVVGKLRESKVARGAQWSRTETQHNFSSDMEKLEGKKVFFLYPCGHLEPKLTDIKTRVLCKTDQRSTKVATHAYHDKGCRDSNRRKGTRKT